MTMTSVFAWPKEVAGRLLVSYLTSPTRKYDPFAVSDTQVLRAVLELGDVLLVEGKQRFSTAVKYLTQSTWSHAALYVGNLAPGRDANDQPLELIEADLARGVTAVSLAKYAGFNTRICRPVGLSGADRRKVAQFMVDSLGLRYDLKNVVDLARYLLPTPPVPVRWRRACWHSAAGIPPA